mmetsp:Transcript_51631/g.93014  ORF Transcript_51631/g.93014 Transcript_51631/m.93014 type:complete len:203 (+) Transcript_51631:702-1310(+)
MPVQTTMQGLFMAVRSLAVPARPSIMQATARAATAGRATGRSFGQLRLRASLKQVTPLVMQATSGSPRASSAAGGVAEALAPKKPTLQQTLRRPLPVLRRGATRRRRHLQRQRPRRRRVPNSGSRLRRPTPRVGRQTARRPTAHDERQLVKPLRILALPELPVLQQRLRRLGRGTNPRGEFARGVLTQASIARKAVGPALAL